MPTPNLSLLMMVVCFGIAYWVVRSQLLDPVTAVVAERTRRIDGAERTWEEKIAEHRSAMERLEQELDDAARAAAERREEARQAALEERHELMQQAREHAETRLDGALAELETEASGAHAELRAAAERLSERLASRLLGREVSR